MASSKFGFRPLVWRLGALAVIVAIGLSGTAWIYSSDAERAPAQDTSSRSKKPPKEASQAAAFQLTDPQWSSLRTEAVSKRVFHKQFVTEGKVALDEDRVTRIFSHYAGRVSRVAVMPGDVVQQGQLLFVVEAVDSVQAQNDLIAAVTALNKASSQLHLAETAERRLGSLYRDKAMPLKDWQESQATLTSAKNDERTAQIAIEAVRNRLRLLGKSDAEIGTFEKSGVITPQTSLYAPLSGIVLQRKLGTGQYVNAGATDSDPALLIGDTSKVWILAFVRESDAPKVKIGQTLKFTTLAFPDQTEQARIDYIAPSLDPASHRLIVRANIDNPSGLLKPEMYASVTVLVEESAATVAVPRDSVIYEGDTTRVWVAGRDRTIESRRIKVGLVNGTMIQVLDGLADGDMVVFQGGLFIDRMVSSN